MRRVSVRSFLSGGEEGRGGTKREVGQTIKEKSLASERGKPSQAKPRQSKRSKRPGMRFAGPVFSLTVVLIFEHDLVLLRLLGLLAAHLCI